MDDLPPPTRTDSGTGLLHISECFLRERDFGSCYKYALKAQESNPNQAGAAQLIAIAGTLRSTHSPTLPNWYNILSLSSSNVEQNAVENRFNLLKGLLNPAENSYPFAAEAYEWVLRAGSVLCDPTRKAYFDNNGGTFWTACPYCYHLYEYEKLFQECFLKCQNDNCRRAFTAVPVVQKAEPPPEVLEKGEYLCHGFYPLGPEQGTGCKRDDWKWWAPLSSMVPGFELSEPAPFDDMKGSGSAHGDAENGEDDVFIEISDDENESKDGGKFGNQYAEFEGVKKEVVEEEHNGGRVVMKRRKMMARSTNKVTGRGIRVNMDEILAKDHRDEAEDSGMEEDGKNYDIRHSDATGSKENHDSGVMLQFCDGGDDVFVGLGADY